MQEKFEKLFYEFKPDYRCSGSWTNNKQAFLHGDKDIPGCNLYWGYQLIKEPVKMEQEPIYHREDENMVFFGATLPDVFSSFDAEIIFYMGPDIDHMEKVVITEPTVIKVPKGWYHCPLTFTRVDKPVFFQAIQFCGTPGSVKVTADAAGNHILAYSEEETHRFKFDPENPGPKSIPWTVINEDGVESYTNKGDYDPAKAPSSLDTVIRPGYESKPYSDATTLKAPKPALSPATTKLVLAMPREETKWGEWCPSPQAYFRGDIYMEDAIINVGYQIFTLANDMEGAHFHQGADEYIFFVGTNLEDIWDYDAEVEIELGDDPDHMETKKLTGPFVIRIPPTLWHCPIRFRKMKKPLVFQAALLHGTWGTIGRKERVGAAPEDGIFAQDYVYEYMGDNVRFCKFNKQKRCNICGGCFKKQAIEE